MSQDRDMNLNEKSVHTMIQASIAKLDKMRDDIVVQTEQLSTMSEPLLKIRDDAESKLDELQKIENTLIDKDEEYTLMLAKLRSI